MHDAFASPAAAGLTLEQYAKAKRLSLDFLRGCDLSEITYDGRPAVRISRVAWIRGGGARTPAPSGSGEADIARASQVQHTIEDVGGDVHLGRPTLIGVRAQPVPDHALELADGGLGPGSFRVSGRPLPGDPALLGNPFEVAVALGRRSLGGRAGHGGRARGYDDGRLRIALGDAGVDAVLIVRPVAGK